MKPRIRLLGLPLHPFLVHFPIAFWLLTPAFDIAALLNPTGPWWMLGLGATVLGVAIGALAIAAGLLEYLQPSLAGIDMRLAAKHGIRTTLAWCVFTAKAVLATLLPFAQWSLLVCLALGLLGCVLLVQGVYFGTRQVYQLLEKD